MVYIKRPWKNIFLKIYENIFYGIFHIRDIPKKFFYGKIGKIYYGNFLILIQSNHPLCKFTADCYNLEARHLTPLL